MNAATPTPPTFNPLNQRAKQSLEREVGEVWASCLTLPAFRACLCRVEGFMLKCSC